MNQYSLTKIRIFQWIIIILVLCAVAAGYFYFRGRAAQTVVDNQPTFEAPLTTTIVPTRGQGSATFTRADGADRRATVTDFEGIVRKVKNGEARFEGARRVENLVTQDVAASPWSGLNGASATGGFTDPLGGTAAVRVSLPSVADQWWSSAGLATVGKQYVKSMWIRADSAGTIGFREGQSSEFVMTVNVTTSWRRISSPVHTATTVNSRMGWRRDSTSDLTQIYVAFPQYEEVSGQANYAPSEYVSRGVLSAPFHGANVDGVKYFDTENGNTVASNVVTEATNGATLEGHAYGSLPGTSGSYFSTPDSSALDITGDLDLRAKVAMSDWTPSGNQALIGKYSTEDNQRAYLLWMSVSGAPALLYSTDGISTNTRTATATTGLADGSAKWIRATLDADNGASGHDVKFYMSDDGVSWTQLGNTVTTAGATSIFPGTAPVGAGAFNPSGTSNFFTGKIYRAIILSGIDGTIAADFDPSQWSSGNTWTSRTSEVWTRNGAASLWKNSLKGYLAEGSRANLLLQSEDLSTSWTVSNTTVTTNATTAPDGTITADKLIESATTAQHYISGANVSFTSGQSYSISAYLKAGERQYGGLFLANASFPDSGRHVMFDLRAGIVAAVESGVTATITPIGNGWYRCTATATADATGSGNSGVQMSSTGAAVANSYTGDGTSGFYVWGAQLEAASFASSYIPTTTASATRAADRLNYTNIPNGLTLQGTMYAEMTDSVLPATGVDAYFLSLTDGTSNNEIEFSKNGGATNGATTRYRSENFESAFLASADGVFTRNTLLRAVARWAPNSFRSGYNGVLTSEDLSGSTPSALDRVSVGYRSANGQDSYGTTKNVKIWDTALPDATLTALTAGTAGTIKQATINSSSNNFLTNGLVGLWSFNGTDMNGTSALDRSGAGNNGTLTGGPTVVPGKVGQALSFDGTDDSASMSPFALGTTYSTSAWVKTTSTSNPIIFTQRKTDGSLDIHFQLGITATTGTASFTVRTTAGVIASAVGASVNDGNWHHVVGVRNGNTLSIYVDGVRGTDATASFGTINSPSNAYIGQLGNSTSYWNGSIDEVRLYSRALAAAEIEGLYNAEKGDALNASQSDSLTQGLAGYWKLDEGSGTTALDGSGNGNTGTVANSPTWSEGRLGNALTFDGTDDYVAISDSPSLDITQAITYSAWVYLTPTNQSGNVLSKSGASWTSYIDVRSTSQAFVCRLTVAGNTTTISWPGGTNGLDPYENKWTHIACAYDGSQRTLYINGVARASSSVTGTLDTNNDALNIGRDPSGTDYANFPIDEVRVYSRALSVGEVERLYGSTSQNGPSAKDANLVSYWSFNGQDVSGTTAYDRSGAGNNGTLTNGPTVTPGKSGQALSFDGTDDHVVLPPIPYNQTRSFSVWLKANNVTQRAGIVGNDHDSLLFTSGLACGALWLNAANITAQVYSNNTYQNVAYAAAAGQWYHVVFVKDVAAQTIALYVNGALSGSTAFTLSSLGVISGTNQCDSNLAKVGRISSNHTSGPDGYFNGSIDEVRVYNTALSAAEITNLYNLGR